MKIKESNGARNILWVFIIVGVLMMTAGICVAIYYGVDSLNYDKVRATIVDIKTSQDSNGDKHYYVTVDYEYNGVQYQDIQINFWDSGMYEGQEIDIYCRKDSPTTIRAGILMILLPCILFGFGMIFALVVAFPLHKELKRNRETKILRSEGELIHCKVVDVIPDTSFRVNGKLVNNKIVCEPIDDREIGTYTSLSFNKKYVIEKGSTINVYRDRREPTKYYVDLNSIDTIQNIEDRIIL